MWTGEFRFFSQSYCPVWPKGCRKQFEAIRFDDGLFINGEKKKKKMNEEKKKPTSPI